MLTKNIHKMKCYFRIDEELKWIHSSPNNKLTPYFMYICECNITQYDTPLHVDYKPLF